MPATAGLLASGHLHRMRASLPGDLGGLLDRFHDRDELRDARHLRFHRLQAGLLRAPLSQFRRPQDEDLLGHPRVHGPEEHRHQPAVDLSRPPDRRRARLGLRRPGHGQGRSAPHLPGRPRQDGLSHRHRHHEGPRATPRSSGRSSTGRPPAGRRPWTSSGARPGIISSSSSPGPTGSTISSGTPTRTRAIPITRRFLDYYRRVDGIIAKASAAFRKLTGGDEGFYLMSDHGFTGIVQEVYLNAWLEREGYLSFANPSPKGLEDIAPGTTAFALDPNRIYLNLKGKFPAGLGGRLREERPSSTGSPAKIEAARIRRPEGRPQGLPGRGRLFRPARRPGPGPHRRRRIRLRHEGLRQEERDLRPLEPPGHAHLGRRHVLVRLRGRRRTWPSPTSPPSS